MNELVFILELLGTAAFAASGATVGMEKKMDIFGISILGMTTAVGGGIIRDVVIGKTPPSAFTNPVYTVVALAVSLLLFLPGVRRRLEKGKKFYDATTVVADAVGLSVFTMVGISNARNFLPEVNIFLLMFVGVITGVGGGVLRDLFAGSMPAIFVKYFYACASLIGAVLCTLLWDVLGGIPSMTIGAVTIFILRMLAARYHWMLPRA